MSDIIQAKLYKNPTENRDWLSEVPTKATSSTNSELLLNEHEVARRQGRSVRTLQNQRVQGGGIPYFKLGRAVRYRLRDVIAWEEARRFNNTSEEGQRNA